MTKIKLAIADNNASFRKSVVTYLKDALDAEFEIVIVADSGNDLFQKMQSMVPNIVIMDIRMPKMNGIEITARIHELDLSIKVIALTNFADDENVIVMSRLGVQSFIEKGDLELLLTAIKVVNEGYVFLPGRIARIIQNRLPSSNADSPNAPINDFSEFEIYLIKSICKGMSSTDIGIASFKSPRTIEDHRNRLYKKFGISRKEELIMEVIRRNII